MGPALGFHIVLRCGGKAQYGVPGAGEVPVRNFGMCRLSMSHHVPSAYRGLHDKSAHGKRQRGDSNPCGQSPMDF